MRYFLRLSKPTHFALGLAMAAIVWGLDLFAPAQVGMSIFYLLPIGFVAWFCGGAWGYAMSTISAAAWFQAEMTNGQTYSQGFIPYWNTVVRLGFFMVVTVLSGSITRLRRLSNQEHKLSELKSSMISLVSHEFGNSLTTFKLSLTLLKESERAETSAQRQMCYATLERVYTHLSGTVANFLNLNRIESGRFIPHTKKTMLRTLVHATIAQMGPIIENHEVELRLDFPTQRVPVKADPDALSVIMSNLIGNAFKYTPAGGTVAVRIAMEAASGTALVSVEDTGIGITEPDQLLISSGYFRAEEGQQVAKGFGIGLKVTRELLESQGVKLEIKSEPGHGSKFSFRLPLWEKRQTEATDITHPISAQS